MKIKVCGITDINQLSSLEKMQVDYVGFIFYPGSPRYFFKNDANRISSYLPSVNLVKTGVFVNASEQFVLSTAKQLGLNLIQLHGNESPLYCKKIQEHYPVMKSFSVSEHLNLDEIITPYRNAADYFLFDTYTALYGGSGKQFNWNQLKTSAIDKPFFLSGGIGPDDAEQVLSFKHKNLYGIDINSRFESAPGIKHIPTLHQFINQIKHHNYE